MHEKRESKNPKKITNYFQSTFQGEKNEGFNVLYQNMKCGTLAAKELTDFFRESAKLEEENAKTHAKLAKQVFMSISINFR